MAAALSPDGRTLMIDLLGSLWTLPASGGAARRVTDEYLDARQPVWAPDNRRVAFQGYADGVWRIYVINADGGELRAITSGPFDDREPSWSRDGTRIAFSSDRSGNYDIWDLDVATGSVRQLTRHAANDFSPAYSPVDARIAGVSGRLTPTQVPKRHWRRLREQSARRRGAATAQRLSTTSSPRTAAS